MRAIPLLIILAVASATGSLLFAAEPAPSSAQPAQKQAPAKAGSPQENADVSTSAVPVAGSKAAQEKDETEKSPEKSAEKSAEKPEEKSAADTASAADKAASPQRFIPSEQVRADFDVSFPVDI